MKELFNREEIRDLIAAYRRISNIETTPYYLYEDSIDGQINTGIDLSDPITTDEDIDKYIDFYKTHQMTKLPHEQFVQELSVYGDYFREHNNQGGLEVIDKLIGDQEIADKCRRLNEEGEEDFFNASISFYLPKEDGEGIVPEFQGVQEGISCTEAVDQLNREYELIPCYWHPFRDLSELSLQMTIDEKVRAIEEDGIFSVKVNDNGEVEIRKMED